MQIGLGLDSRLGLPTATLRDVAVEARQLGYGSVWTNAGIDYDPIGMCVAWNQQSGLPTGVSVVPIARNPPAVLGLAARTAFELSDGQFVLGVGSGSITERPIRVVREYLGEIRKVAPHVQLAVGALGPQMLRLASTHADAAALNWCTAEQVRWSREQVGRKTRLVEYLRVCVDTDVDAARQALAQQILAYALLVRPSGARGYRNHFERMGFGAELAELETKRGAGADDERLVTEMPDRLIRSFGYAGTGEGAREWFAGIAEGLDVAIVRVLTPRPGDIEPVRAAMRAFAPAH